MIWKWKMLSFSSFESRKPNVKFWTYEVTKPKLKPKPLPSHEAEAKALNFWNYKAEAEATALASNASALWSRSGFVPKSDWHWVATPRSHSTMIPRTNGVLGPTRYLISWASPGYPLYRPILVIVPLPRLCHGMLRSLKFYCNKSVKSPQRRQDKRVQVGAALMGHLWQK